KDAMCIDPEGEEGDCPPESAAVAVTVFFDEKEQEAKGQEGEGLRAYCPTLNTHQHADHGGPYARADTIVRRVCAQSQCVARSNRQCVDKDCQRHAAPCHELRQYYLHQPCLIDPGGTNLRI